MREAHVQELTEELTPPTDFDRRVSGQLLSKPLQVLAVEKPDEHARTLKTWARWGRAIAAIAADRRHVALAVDTRERKTRALQDIDRRARQLATDLRLDLEVNALDTAIGSQVGRAIRGFIGQEGAWTEKPASVSTPASEATAREIRAVVRGWTPEERNRRYLDAVSSGSDPLLVDAVEGGATSAALALVSGDVLKEANRHRIAASPLAPHIQHLHALRQVQVEVRRAALTALDLTEVEIPNEVLNLLPPIE